MSKKSDEGTRPGIPQGTPPMEDPVERLRACECAKGVLEEQLRFEKLLSEISSVYTNLPVNEIDRTIAFGLQRIGTYLQVDRCNLAHYFEHQTEVRIVHSWGDDGIGPLPDFHPDATAHFPWTIERLKQGNVVSFSCLEDLPVGAEIDQLNYRRHETCAHASVPITVGGTIVGSLSVGARDYRVWSEELVQRLRRAGEIFANALARKRKELEVHDAFLEIQRLKDQLEADCSYLREEIESEYDFHKMIGQSDTLKYAIGSINKIAATDITVLIMGETGTGKELVARAIHGASTRRDRPMVKVNCAALSSNLIESELFGHEKGAFTSAQARQVGRFELADGNTLFLDEIGELPLESQAKLLRVLQEGEFERLGSSRTIKVDVRVIAATNRDLEEEVRKGRFRQDLWYRLNVYPITVPPLRHRKEDIPLLVNWFVNRFCRKMGREIRRIPSTVMNALINHHWPGNVRELENVIERAVINSAGHSLHLLGKLNSSLADDPVTAQVMTLDEVERNHIILVLEKTKWRIDGPRGAAVLLGINPSTLRFRIRKLGIQRSTAVD